MARKPRIEIEGGLYHLIVRGNHKEDIFLEERDYRKFLELLQKYYKKFDFALYAYVLMRNHFHLLVEKGYTSISSIMQGLNQSYTQYFNKKYHKTGHLFQGRYKSILCDKNSYFLHLVRYIHLNPVRAEIVSSPDEYRWSSHHIYMGRIKSEIINRMFVLGLFSEDLEKATKQYEKFIIDGMGVVDKDFEKGTYIGDKESIENVKKELHSIPVIQLSLDTITDFVCKSTGIEKEKLFLISRNRISARARGMVGYLARQFGGYTVTEIGQYLHKGIAAISYMIIKVEENIPEELIQEFKEKYLNT